MLHLEKTPTERSEREPASGHSNISDPNKQGKDKYVETVSFWRRLKMLCTNCVMALILFKCTLQILCHRTITFKTSPESICSHLRTGLELLLLLFCKMNLFFPQWTFSFPIQFHGNSTFVQILGQDLCGLKVLSRWYWLDFNPLIQTGKAVWVKWEVEVAARQCFIYFASSSMVLRSLLINGKEHFVFHLLMSLHS